MSERRQRQDPDSPKRRKADKIACPFCGWPQSTAISYHPNADEQVSDGWPRRRRCDNPECARRYPTKEVIDTDRLRDFIS